MTIRSTFARATAAAALLTLTACGGSGAPTPSASPDQDRFYDQYVALGDSYTSAPLVGTVAIDDACVRSGIDYPRLLARYLGASLSDRSCNGADTTHLTGKQTVDQSTIAPQLDAVTPQTDLVTVGIGANPAAMGAWFSTCPELREQDPEGAPCRAHFQEGGKDKITQALAAGRKQLVAALKIVRKRAPEARVMVMGYPAIFPAKGGCPKITGLAKGDQAYAREILHTLNSDLEKAAKKGHAEYVDVYAATVGHDLCSEDPWIQGRKDDLGVALAWHPHAEEQRAVADLLLRRLR